MKKERLEPIDPSLIEERIRYENPWWYSNDVDEGFQNLSPRLFFDSFFELVTLTEIKRAVVLLGPRRVGKTVMMLHAVQRLLNDGVDPMKICFFSMDNPIYLNKGLEELFGKVRKISGMESPKGWYVFFDEIQYLKNWEQHLKVLVDSYPSAKFVVSGSASAALRLKSIESGAGRFTEYLLPPLTFEEYLRLKNLSRLIIQEGKLQSGSRDIFFRAADIKELNRHFVEYINFGGYPEIILAGRMMKNPGRYIKNDIVDKVLLRDLPGLYGITDVQELNAFFSTLVYYSGNEVSIEALSQSSGIEKYMINKYLAYLEAAFLIKIIHRIDESAKKFRRANFYKIYVTNTALRTALFSPITSTDNAMGAMVETAVFAQLFTNTDPLWYARWNKGSVKGEVDLVYLDRGSLKPYRAIEIKWTNRYFEKPEDLKSLIWFCKSNNLRTCTVTTIDQTGEFTDDSLNIKFIPASLFAYETAYKMLRSIVV